MAYSSIRAYLYHKYCISAAFFNAHLTCLHAVLTHLCYDVVSFWCISSAFWYLFFIPEPCFYGSAEGSNFNQIYLFPCIPVCLYGLLRECRRIKKNKVFKKMHWYELVWNKQCKKQRKRSRDPTYGGQSSDVNVTYFAATF